MSPVTVRAATPADVPAIAAIYTHYVLKTTVTCNTEVRTPRQWLERFASINSGPYQVLVAEEGGHVVGFVETQRFRPKAAYDRSIELTVYVAPDTVGRGVGSALYRELLADLDADGRFHRAYVVVALPNDTSIAFHERFGFVHRGTLTEAGYKFGRYLDVAYLERPIGAQASAVTGGGPATTSERGGQVDPA